MKNETASQPFGKTPIGQFERMGSRTEKAAIRRMAKKANRQLDLSKLHQLPLYQRLEQAILSDEFKQTLQNHGLTSVLEVASLKNYTALKQHIEQKAAQTRTTLPQPSYRFYEAAKREARKVDNKDQGLSAPYGLALDLERMDLAYTQYLFNKSDTA